MKLLRESIFKKFFEWIDSINDIEEKLFWVVSPLTFVIALVSTIMTILEGLGFIAVMCATICTFCTVLIIVYALFCRNYSQSYVLLVCFLGGVFMPVTFFCNGGFRSGMPLFLAGTTQLCFFCIRNKDRIASFLFCLAANMGAFLIAKEFPNMIAALDEDFINTDIMYSFLLVEISLFAINSVVINEFKFYTTTKNVITHFMDDNIRNVLMKSESYESLVNRPGQKARVTVLFADISNFTTYSELLSPEDTIEFLNIFLSIAEECVHKNGGTLDKYIGDCIMAFWLDPKENGDGVYQACQTVIDIQQKLYEIADVVYDRFKNELTFGAGINYGYGIVGGIGSQNRKDFTVTGDAVNIASRLQSMAPRGTYYLSESAAKIMEGRAELVQVHRQIMLKGISRPVDIFSLRSLGEKKDEGERMQIYNSNTGYQLHICGCRGSYSVAGFRYSEYGGETSCYVIKRNDHAVVVDCGSGLYNARDLLKSCTKIDVLLTHVHYDHIIGLLDYSVFPRNAELKLYGTFSEWHGDETINTMLQPPYWPINLSRGNMIEITRESPFNLNDDVEVTFYKATHPNNASLIVLNILGRKICVMADCENPYDLPDYEVRGSDIVLFDGMFEDETYQDHIGWGHSTWQSGVRLAEEMNTQRMIITHHNPQSNDAKLRELESRAKNDCPNVSFAREGDAYMI